jgi:GWxTD domain-containing protein
MGPTVLLLLATLAQSPADRASLEALRDSLAGVSDSAGLHQLEAATITVARQHRDDPMIHLRLGFVAYRLGEITTVKSHYDDAAGEFEWAGELRPDWPYPWYGLGLAELANGENASIALENIRQMLGKDYLSKAARAFARATEADPSFASAVVDLANTALTQRIRPRLEVALNAVRLAAAGPAGRHGDVQLVRGRVEREAGEADSAVAAFETYLRIGGDSGIGLLELARTAYFASRPTQGWVSYFAGARAATSAQALTMYRLDLSWIADSAQLVAFDGLATPDARQHWLQEFWTRRDVVEARDVGERLAEHYRRWFYARRNFRLVSRHRHYDITEVYRTRQVEFDDRGVIYLRHGEPDKRAQFICQSPLEPNGEGCAANESWLYRRRGEPDLIFHFAARDDVQDFKLIESLADVLGFHRAVRASSFSDPEIAALYQTRDQFGQLYSRVAHSQRAAGTELAQDRQQGRRNITIGTTTDSYVQRFEQPLDVVATEFVVGAGAGGGASASGADSGQVLHVVFAIPADRLEPQPSGDGVRYPLEFRVIISDSSDRVVANLDTVRVFGAHQALRRPSYLTGRLAVPVPAGNYQYRLLVRSVDGGAGDLLVEPLTVERLEPQRFAVSDLVVGREGSGLVWFSPAGDTVRLNPLQRFPEGSAVNLYYEIYGLSTGTPYHTVVRLEREGGGSFFGAIGRLFGGGRSPVLLEFDAPSTGTVTRVQRGIELRDVSKGTYRLAVVITDPATGTSVTRVQRFQVVQR